MFQNKYLKYWGVLVFIVLWALLKLLFFQNNNFLPSPLETFTKTFEFFKTQMFYYDLFSTLQLFLSGFVLAVLFGVPIGFLLGYFQKGYALFEIIIDFFRSIPVTALFPLFILLFGIGKTTITAMVTVACVFVIIVNTAYGVIYANKNYFKVMDLMKATWQQKFREVIIYEALPFLFVGLRVAVSFGLIVVVVSEMFIGSQYGLGARVYKAHETYLIVDVYALIIIIGLLGYFLNRFFVYLETKIIHWKGKNFEN